MFTKLKNIKLKKSEKRAVKLAVVVTVFVVLFNLVIYPFYQSYNDLKREKVKYTKDLKMINEKIKESKTLMKQVATLKRRFEEGQKKLIKAKNIELAQVFLEETISDYAKKRDLKIVRIYKERAKDEQGFKVVKARVTIKGNYGDIIDFLHDLENNQYYLFAESLIIRYYRGIEAVVSVKGIIKLKENNGEAAKEAKK